MRIGSLFFDLSNNLVDQVIRYHTCKAFFVFNQSSSLI